MGKGAIKFGGQSGILPKPREIFKQPYKHQVYQKPRDTGYAEGILHPKGISRDYLVPKVFSPEERLKKSASEPAKKYNTSEISKLPIEQQFKVKNAEMRRQYLKDSYTKEVYRLEKAEGYKKESLLEQEKLDQEKSNHKQSMSEHFTIPTIESYLEGSLIRQRTKEEKKALKIKRESNRLQTKLNVDTEKAMRLMELYNSSSNFAITEDKLKLLVDNAFSDKADQEWSKVLSATPDKLSSTPNSTEFDSKLCDIILGNVNKGPGFEIVEDTLNGFNNDIQELAKQVMQEQQLKKIQEAEEKQKKLNEIQQTMESQQ